MKRETYPKQVWVEGGLVESPSCRARHSLNLLLAQPLLPESDREPVGGVARVMRWWAESSGSQQAVIKQAVINELQWLARPKGALNEPRNARQLTLLAQLAVEMNLDERARDILWGIAQRGRISGGTGSQLPHATECYLLAWVSVIGLPEWLPQWENLWNGPHSDLWPVAFGAVMNIDPEWAAVRIPKLLERRGTIGTERCGRLLFRLVQKDITWPKIGRVWVDENPARDAELPTRVENEVQTLVNKLLQMSDSPAVREGLGRFHTVVTTGQLPISS